jgi:endogenous inhibitor of DNA gyrase (YacG/DUF329 family)
MAAPKPPVNVRCPICGKVVAWTDNPDRPFCSERCRLVDLARWADGSYAMPGPPAQSPDEGPETE